MREAASRAKLPMALGPNIFQPDTTEFGLDLMRCSPRIRKAAHRLVIDFMRNITIEEIARDLGVHPCHLERESKNYCGSITLKQLLIGIRLQYCVFLMADKTLKLNVIGEMSGFSDPKNFSRSFRTHMGVTASEFRKLHTVEDFVPIFQKHRLARLTEDHQRKNVLPMQRNGIDKRRFSK